MLLLPMLIRSMDPPPLLLNSDPFSSPADEGLLEAMELTDSNDIQYLYHVIERDPLYTMRVKRTCNCK